VRTRFAQGPALLTEGLSRIEEARQASSPCGLLGASVGLSVRTLGNSGQHRATSSGHLYPDQVTVR